MRFDQESYENGSPIQRYTKVSWFEIPMTATKYLEKVVFTELVREDSLLMTLSGLTTESELFYAFEFDSELSRPYDYNTRLSFEIFLDLNQVSIDR